MRAAGFIQWEALGDQWLDFLVTKQIKQRA